MCELPNNRHRRRPNDAGPVGSGKDRAVRDGGAPAAEVAGAVHAQWWQSVRDGLWRETTGGVRRIGISGVRTGGTESVGDRSPLRCSRVRIFAFFGSQKFQVFNEINHSCQLPICKYVCYKRSFIVRCLFNYV